MLKKLAALTVLSTLVLALVAAAPAQAVRRVKMDNTEFIPVVKEIRKGKLVVWKNTSGVGHEVDSTSDNWEKEDHIGIGDTTEYLFKQAGIYKYTCEYHSGMNGRIVVR